MFEKNYEQRLASWSKFRESLETDPDPLRSVLKCYKDAPKVNFYTDPWTEEMWPNPWEMILENTYDDFCCVLGMYYSLQLTERFKASSFEIHIYVDDSKGYCYLLFVDDFVLGYSDDEVLHVNDLPRDFKSQHVYPMSTIQ